MIYKFVEVVKDEFSYTLNFMRYTYDENGKVGCTMRAIQFHKAQINGHKNSKKNEGYINMDNDNNFAICYTETDKDSNDGVDKSKYSETNGINVCYNPPVKWPFENLDEKEKNKRIEDIVDWFVDFVEKDGIVEKL